MLFNKIDRSWWSMVIYLWVWTVCGGKVFSILHIYQNKHSHCICSTQTIHIYLYVHLRDRSGLYLLFYCFYSCIFIIVIIVIYEIAIKNNATQICSLYLSPIYSFYLSPIYTLYLYSLFLYLLAHYLIQ